MRIYTANQHMLIFCAKKYGTGWVGGWEDGWMGGRARLSIAYSNQKSELFFTHITTPKIIRTPI